MKIILCDLSHKRDGRFSSEYIPYPIGCIKSYFCANFEADIDFSVELIKDPEELSSQIEQLSKDAQPLIFGFSCYMWNHNLSMSYASAIKKLFPDSLIVFGGPDFPLEIEEKRLWLQERPCIDLFIEGEGEKPFLSAVEVFCASGFKVLKEDLARIPSIFSILDDNTLAHSSDLAKDGFIKSARIENLDATPSPYLMGYLDKFLIEGNLVPLMESNRGCPFTCTFCVDGNAARSKVFKVHPNRLGEELYYIAARYKGSTLALADTNFGMYREDFEFCKMLAACRKETGYPQYINTSTGKNQKERIIACAELVEGAMRVAASVQTLDPIILKNIKRSNISSDQLVAMSERLSGGISNTYAELILGLPGDSEATHISSVSDCVDAGYNQIRMHTLTLLNGSVMGTIEDRERWGFQTKHRGLQRCFGTYKLFNNTMNVIETEEVVVSQRSMPFSDYLNCRLYNLTIAVFYNEEVLRELIVFLKGKNLKPSDWLNFVWKNILKTSGPIKDIFCRFLELTERELYSDPSDIVTKFSVDDSFRGDVFQGKVGYNLLLDTQGEILISHFDDLIDVTCILLQDFLKEVGSKVSPNEIAEINQIGRFISLKRRNIFNVSEEYVEEFNSALLYRISSAPSKVDERSTPFLVRFYFQERIAEFISDQARIYGTTKEGIGKIIARSPIKDFQRQVEVIEG